MSAKEGGWGGGGGGRERPPPPLMLFFPPPVAILFFAALSSVAVLAVAVPLAEGPATEERPPEGLGGCVYGGSEYKEGEAVATDQQCLNCTCSRGALICHLRACPPMPLAPGCTAVRTESHACCPSIVCDDNGGTERIPVEETTVRVKTTTSGCYVDRQHHEEGANVPGKAGRCEYCLCANGKVNCEPMPCPPSPVGCTPLFNHGSDCCPSRYDCSGDPSLTLQSIEHEIVLESVILSPKSAEIKLYEETSEKVDDSGATEEYSGSVYSQITQIPQSPPPLQSTASPPSGSADGRKNRHMGSTTEDDRRAEIPSDGTVGGSVGTSATQEEDIAETSETVDGGWWSASTTDQTATETEEALTSDATTELNVENTKREGETDETATAATTTEEITMLPVTEESCSPGVEGGEEDTEGMTTTTTTSEGMETTSTAEEGLVTEEGESDATQTTTPPADAGEGTTSETTTTEYSEEGTTAITVDAKNATSEEGNASHTVTEETNGVIDVVGSNSSAIVDMGEKDLSQKSSHVVDIGAEGIDCSEVGVNQSTENEKEEESATMSSEKAANQSSALEGEAENALKGGKANETEGVILETTLSPLGNSMTTTLPSIDRKKDVDYEEYDYNEPTLPPSLPNLRIIPFVAADAVVENDNHKTTENTIFYDGAPPSLFSPPVETEGGFVPRDPPILHEVTYQSPVLSDVLPSDVGLVGIAAIEITTTSKPNVLGNFGQLNNDSNVMMNSGVLNPVDLSEKAPHPHIKDIRPPSLDNKLSSISLIPTNFTLHNTSMGTLLNFENLKASTATSMPLTKIPLNGSNLFPPTNDGNFGPVFSSKNSTIKKPGGITSSSQITSSPSTGHSSAEVPRIPYPDRVSEIPFGPTPPRPSPSTSPSYSVGPNLPPEKPPSPSTISMPPSRPQNSPVVGLLKLAGCNIYGRMYRVGRIISELSGPCLECRCTEVGVQCRPLPC